MFLQGFTSLPELATAPGAPVDAFQADAFRRNDLLFEGVLKALLASPFVPNGTDGTPADAALDPRRFINAREIAVGTPKTLASRVPLIWFARERIVLNASIDGRGRGAQTGETGDFGGSGGGGAAAGQNCVMPFGTDIILQGGVASNQGNDLDSLSVADAWKLSRALLYLPYLKGGAAGAGASAGAAGTPDHGAGGGVVCLCAPVIELRGAAQIDVRGADANSNTTGGGGGGLVILIARQLVNVNIGVNVLVNGGTAPAGGSGKAGGNGKVIPSLTYQ